VDSFNSKVAGKSLLLVIMNLFVNAPFRTLLKQTEPCGVSPDIFSTLEALF